MEFEGRFLRILVQNELQGWLECRMKLLDSQGVPTERHIEFASYIQRMKKPEALQSCSYAYEVILVHFGSLPRPS